MSVNKGILVSANQLNELIRHNQCVTVDCRFDLVNPETGRQEWLEGHVPGASYAHLDNDLAAPIEAHTGRHPLPETGKFAHFLATIGWTEDKLLVAYDDASSAYAVRLWWLMRYYGKPAAVLDGGLAAWKAAGFDLQAGEERCDFSAVPELVADHKMILTSAQVHSGLDELAIVDARASERFRGEFETLDTKAGHIPGGLNRPFGANLHMNGRFRDPEVLKEEFSDLLEEAGLDTVVHSCGSGVTACHNLFAMELAGLPGTRLYPGSWSEWIRDPDRPIATGPGDS
jgi:thiosulfate/3-mercaptopyruvate sulfurtransferase